MYLAPGVVLYAMYLHGEKHDTRHVERQKHDDGKEQGSSLADLYPSVPACIACWW